MSRYNINDEVPLNSKGQNANIKANILSDDEMRSLGLLTTQKIDGIFVEELVVKIVILVLISLLTRKLKTFR